VKNKFLIVSLIVMVLLTLTTTSILAAGMSKEQLTEVQKELKEESFYSGQIDGLYGPQTAKAIRNYQKANDLKVDSRNIEDNYVLILNNNKEKESANTIVGLSKPAFGAARYNDKGEIKAFHGINWGLGYSYRGYFTPLKEGINGYWEAGTVAILVPYAEAGADFVFGMEDDGSHWSINVGAQVLTNFEEAVVLPSLGISRRF